MTSKPNVATLYSSFASGSDATLSLIEVSISPGIPTFSVIGLCDSSIRESEGRLRSAFKSAGFIMPKGHITVGISPAYMRKTGTGFDLALAMGILFAQQIAGIFVGYDPETLELATKAIRIGSLSFLLQGVNIVSASTFTGLGEGTLSVVVSLFHSLIGPAVFVFLLPWVFGADGIWAAQPAGALLTAVVAILLLLRYNKSKMAVLKEKRNL